jgi:hypothetical protein
MLLQSVEPLLIFYLLLGHFQPSFERNFKVHNCQEWIHTIFFLNDPVENLLVTDLASAFFLRSLSFHVDIELSSELKDLHFLVDLHVSVLSSHTSIEHLIKEYISIVRFDGHFEKLLLELTVIVLLLTKA